jgi:hypothetical protein
MRKYCLFYFQLAGVSAHVKTTLHSTGQRPVASPSVKDDMQSCFTTRIPPHHQLQTGGMLDIN